MEDPDGWKEFERIVELQGKCPYWMSSEYLAEELCQDRIRQYDKLGWVEKLFCKRPLRPDGSMIVYDPCFIENFSEAYNKMFVVVDDSTCEVTRYKRVDNSQ